MRIALRNLCVVAVTFLLMCCKDMSNSPIIQVKDVREVDYLNKTGDVIEGTFIKEIMGGISTEVQSGISSFKSILKG